MAIKCTRFEQEALLKLERGEELDDLHFKQCEDCIQAMEHYEAIKKTFANLHADATPTDSWQGQVLEKIKRVPEKQERGYRWQAAMAAGVGCVAMVLVFFLPWNDAANDLLIMEVMSGENRFRSNSAKPGDTLLVNGAIGNLPITVIRAYRDDRLHFQCGDAMPCERDGDRILASIPLQARGEYRVVLIQSSAPFSLLANRLDADAMAAREAGAQLQLSSSLFVR